MQLPELSGDLTSQCCYLGTVNEVHIAYPSCSSSSTNLGQSSSDRRDSVQSLEEAGFYRDRSPEEQLIDQIENAQLTGRLPLSGTMPDDLVNLCLDAHGLRLYRASSTPLTATIITTGDATPPPPPPISHSPCLDRLELRCIAQTILFEDELDHTNLAVLVGGSNPFKCYVFQYGKNDESSAKEMMSNFNLVFEKIEAMAMD